MGVHRERVDPLTDEEDIGLVHRRWILPDDLARGVGLAQLTRLWRGLLELSVLDENDEVMYQRLKLPLPDQDEAQAESRDIPASASAGLLLAGSSCVTLVTQVVRLDEGHRDPYRLPGTQNGAIEEGEWRDYTLYAVEHEGTFLIPIGLESITCGSCAAEANVDLPWFGEAQLLEIGVYSCPDCGAKMDASRDKAQLLTGDVFLLEEVCCKAALAIELPEEPASEELPDQAVKSLLADAFGGVDELAHDGVEPS